MASTASQGVEKRKAKSAGKRGSTGTDPVTSGGVTSSAGSTAGSQRAESPEEYFKKLRQSMSKNKTHIFSLLAAVQAVLALCKGCLSILYPESVVLGEWRVTLVFSLSNSILVVWCSYYVHNMYCAVVSTSISIPKKLKDKFLRVSRFVVLAVSLVIFMIFGIVFMASFTPSLKQAALYTYNTVSLFIQCVCLAFLL